VKKKPIPAKGIRYRLTDILWWTRPEDVFKEIASILNMVSADTSTPGWFQLRTTATKKILDRMNDEEKKTLEDEADRIEKDGLPRDIQRK
jgi:hypothetical protein